MNQAGLATGGVVLAFGATIAGLFGVAILGGAGGGDTTPGPCASPVASTAPTPSATASPSAGVLPLPDPCGGPDSVGEVVDGWTRPLQGATSISSHYGMRYHPVDHVWRLHAGTDMPEPCGTPIYAAAGGTVIAAAGSGVSMQLDLVWIDHGGGVTTAYMHEYADEIYVSPGDVVRTGEHISDVGNAGNSTGCHLHFEVRRNGSSTDPEPFMAERGVPLP
jgi:murein DD-endopeptidase MepM/ murein hydrolase activator NlpD